ncbi:MULTISPECIES: hypothetical protein [unclassified Mycobacterium]|nr:MULTISPECIES: hypothetical protein [unclassified Mycobacterium]
MRLDGRTAQLGLGRPKTGEMARFHPMGHVDGEQMPRTEAVL